MFGSLSYWLLKGLFKEEPEASMDPALVERIEEELSKAQSDNYSEARKVHPSEHLRNDEDAWFKMIEKQREYSGSLNKSFEKLIADKYNLTRKQLKMIKSALFVKDTKKLKSLS